MDVLAPSAPGALGLNLTLALPASAGAGGANTTAALSAALAALLAVLSGGAGPGSLSASWARVEAPLRLAALSAAGAPGGVEAPLRLAALSAAGAPGGGLWARAPWAAPPSAYPLRASLGPLTLEWAWPQAGAPADRLHARLTCAPGGGWCGLGSNDAPLMSGATALALEPARGAQGVGAWFLGGREASAIAPARSMLLDAAAAGGYAPELRPGAGAGGGAVGVFAWATGDGGGRAPADPAAGASLLLVWAWGPGGGMGPHSAAASGAGRLDLLTGRLQLLAARLSPAVIAHALLMLGAWALLAPGAAGVARFCRRLPPAAKAPGGPPPWFARHVALGVAATLASLLGAAVALATRGEGRPHLDSTHERLGGAVVLAGLLQAAGGRCAPRGLHRAWGYATLAAAAAAIFTGIAQSGSEHAPLLTALYAAWIAALGALWLAAEACARCPRSSAKPPPEALAPHPQGGGSSSGSAASDGGAAGSLNQAHSAARAQAQGEAQGEAQAQTQAQGEAREAHFATTDGTRARLAAVSGARPPPPPPVAPRRGAGGLAHEVPV